MRSYNARRSRYRVRYQQVTTLMKKYGLTPEDYDIILDKQGRKCAICLKANHTKRLSVDHCHKTNAIRGLLCLVCNTKLGWFEKYRYEILSYVDHGKRWGRDTRNADR